MTNSEQLVIDQIRQGKLSIKDPDERYQISHMPAEWRALTQKEWRNRDTNPLPKGKSALHPSTVAGWPTEALLRAQVSNLCHGDSPEHLIIYGGSGQLANDWKSLMAIRKSITELNPDETLHVAAGKPYFVFPSFQGQRNPRVIISNSMIVGNWADYFPQYNSAGMLPFGQMTAGSWIFIGYQGIIQGTYETGAKAVEIAESRAEYKNMSALEQRLMVSSGLGFMSGAQPLAYKLAYSPSSGKRNKIALIAEVDSRKIDIAKERGFVDVRADSIEESLEIGRHYAGKDESVSIGVHANAIDLLEALVEQKITPHFLTDQTSAHEILQTNTEGKNAYGNFGYCPQGWTAEQALDKRNNSPKEFVERSLDSVIKHTRLMLALQERGAVATDYGNFIVGTAMKAGYNDASQIGGFVPMFVRPLFCEGRGPFRWEVLSNDPSDRNVTDDYAKLLLFDDPVSSTWLDLAPKYVPLEPGLPARLVWAGYGGIHEPGRAAVAMMFNKLIYDGKIKAPIIIGRDQLDGGSVASPQRETRAMIDGSDAIACYPLHNFASASMNGAISVAMHDGGGVGVGNSLATNYIALADGTPEAQDKLFYLLMSDTMTGIMRHAVSGEPHALEMVNKHGLYRPGEPFRIDLKSMYKEISNMVRARTGVELHKTNLN